MSNAEASEIIQGLTFTAQTPDDQEDDVGVGCAAATTARDTADCIDVAEDLVSESLVISFINSPVIAENANIAPCTEYKAGVAITISGDFDEATGLNPLPPLDPIGEAMNLFEFPVTQLSPGFYFLYVFSLITFSYHNKDKSGLFRIF